MGGKVRRITTEGKVMEEPLDTALIPRLMSFLKLEKGKNVFGVLREFLHVSVFLWSYDLIIYFLESSSGLDQVTLRWLIISLLKES